MTEPGSSWIQGLLGCGGGLADCDLWGYWMPGGSNSSSGSLCWRPPKTSSSITRDAGSPIMLFVGPSSETLLAGSLMPWFLVSLVLDLSRTIPEAKGSLT